MRKVLLLLDGIGNDPGIIDEATTLAGRGGTVAIMTHKNPTVSTNGKDSLDDRAGRVLDAIRSRGVSAQIICSPAPDVSGKVTDNVEAAHADIVVCEMPAWYSHTSAESRLPWKVLTHSPVPFMIRHLAKDEVWPVLLGKRHILVPLDGSRGAELALPLAVDLAVDWDALIDVIQVVPEVSIERDVAEAKAYVADVASRTPRCSAQVAWGDPIQKVTDLIRDERITHVVMASHRRTGLGHLLLGSFAQVLTHRVTLPVIVVPMVKHHVGSEHEHVRSVDPVGV